MRAAITGATGFIGRHLAEHLLERHYHVRVLEHQRPIDLPVEKVHGSLLDDGVLDDLLSGVDVLFHLGAALGGRALSAREFRRVNRDGSERIALAAIARRVARMVHFSSAGVYGRSSGLTPLAENGPLNPVDSYEMSKLAGEQAVLALAERLDVSVIRPGWVYGEGDRRTFKLIKQINSGPFFIVGSGRVKHSPIHIADLLELTEKIAVSGRRGEVYNGGGVNLAVNDMVQTIAVILKKKPPRLRVPAALIVPAAWLLDQLALLTGRELVLSSAKLAFFRRGKPLDMTKVEKEFGFVSRFDFAAGMSRAVNWYRDQGWL